MLIDALLSFVPLGAPLSLVGAANQTFRSSVIDLLGNGVGQAPTSIIGNATVFGEDPGVGGLRPELMIGVGTAFIGAAGQLLKIALQAAADQGAAGNYQPSTWTDVISQDAIALANLAANAVPFRAPWIPTMPPGLRPRFLSLLFSPMTAASLPSGNFTAGTIAYATVTTVRDDYAAKFQARNFTVA